MSKEQRITIYKSNNIIQKIKEFFKKVFNKFRYPENSHIQEKIVYSTNNFKENIVIKEDEERLRILKIQEDYKNGLIEEEDIQKEDYQKLLDLYDEQNQNINQEIERDKMEIKNMLEKLKKQ